MPKVNEITVTHDQLVSVSNRMHKLVNRLLSQGTLEWALFQALTEELGVNLFELNPDECGCGDKKDPSESMCEKCRMDISDRIRRNKIS